MQLLKQLIASWHLNLLLYIYMQDAQMSIKALLCDVRMVAEYCFGFNYKLASKYIQIDGCT